MDRIHTRKETVLKGLPLSEGYAVARVCLFNEKRHSNLPLYKVAGEGVAKEIGRFQRAIAIAGERLDAVRQEVAAAVGPAEAEIFVAQKMIMEDRALVDQIVALIRGDGANAETAVARVLDAAEARLQALDNEYIKERASDIGEIKRRLLDVFGNMRPELQCADEAHCQRGRNRIVVAEEMTPTLTTELDTQRLMGLATERGGYNSHGAILARALGIPAVSGLRGIRAALSCGTELLVNGVTGEVVVWPSEDTVARVAAAQPAAERQPAPVAPVAGFKVLANIRLAADAAEAMRMEAEGIGLYRTEIELIQANRPLGEDELHERYAAVFAAMAGREVIYRLFDIGSDKKPPFLELSEEENPALGWRGARLLLGRPDLLVAQARALARLSRRGAVKVMYPMVVDLEQFRELRAAFEKAVAGVERGPMAHGIMLEVPSACLQADALLAEADFASIGSNDLMQYLFAVDRNNDRVAYDFNYDKPAFWDLLERVARAAARAGKPLSVCGEMAGDPKYVPRLLAIGIRTVSVSSRRIPAARLAAQRALAAGGA